MVVGAASDLETSLGYPRRERVDLVLLDQELTGRDGTQLLESLFPWLEDARGGEAPPAVWFCTGHACGTPEAQKMLAKGHHGPGPPPRRAPARGRGLPFQRGRQRAALTIPR
jgi:hypothetical protein